MYMYRCFVIACVTNVYAGVGEIVSGGIASQKILLGYQTAGIYIVYYIFNDADQVAVV